MAKIKQSPKLPADQRKMQLLMAAQTIFSRKGYKETTADEIAREAGLTKGAIYFHFKSKEDILFDLIKLVTGHFYELAIQNQDKLKSPYDYLELYVNAKSLKSDHGGLAHNLDFWVQAMSIPRIRKHINRNFRKILDKFSETVDSRYGRTKAERYQLGILTFSLVDGLMVRQVLDSTLVYKEKQLRLFEKMISCFSDKRKTSK